MSDKGLGFARSRENIDPNGAVIPGYAGRGTQIGGPPKDDPRQQFAQDAGFDIRKRVFDARRDGGGQDTTAIGGIYDQFERDWLARAEQYGLSEEEAQEMLDTVLEGDWSA